MVVLIHISPPFLLVAPEAGDVCAGCCLVSGAENGGINEQTWKNGKNDVEIWDFTVEFNGLALDLTLLQLYKRFDGCWMKL